MRHIIQRQSFEISASTAPLCHLFESRVARLNRDVIVPRLEKFFDRQSDTHTRTVVNRLELDVGILEQRMSDEDIWRRIEGALDEAWRAVNTIRRESNEPIAQSHGRAPEPHPVESREIFEERSWALESFAHFLIHGRLPWWFEGENLDWTGSWVTSLNRKEADTIKSVLAVEDRACLRLIAQFSDTFLIGLLHHFQKGAETHTEIIWKTIVSISKKHNLAVSPSLRRAYWIHWIRKSCGGESQDIGLVREILDWRRAVSAAFESDVDDPNIALLQEWFSSLERRVPSGHGDRMEVAEETDISRTCKSAEEGQAENADSSKSPASNDALNGNPAAHSGLENGIVDGGKGRRSSFDANSLRPRVKMGTLRDRGTIGPTTENGPLSIQAEAEDIFAEAAGLVILHPFLAELFRECKLFRDRSWTFPEAQHTAVLLLTWLAHGRTERPEYLLLMEKLLCGLPLEEPYEKPSSMPANHLSNCGRLLDAVIEHWKAPGRISHDGLREGFLHRLGRIRKRENVWSITVEKKTQDILLAKLPWGVSIIHFPWLGKERIQVDWT